MTYTIYDFTTGIELFEISLPVEADPVVGKFLTNGDTKLKIINIDYDKLYVTNVQHIKVNNYEKTMEDKEQEMKEFIKPFLTNLTIVHKEKYPYSVFYTQDGEILFELFQNRKLRYFFVHYDKIWAVYHDRFGLNSDETRSFIKNLVESKLKLNDITLYLPDSDILD